eukprot:TRINITY_DN11129_c0_g1_i2.p1 TRINITY_DN11129_c0_g1~~TRINITY_DN11129_c0_g1_i2.p1  ORF type:complete len:349 (-),score=41.24 TRINITY_DN11129_c0_g1_i2:220-1266(-)
MANIHTLADFDKPNASPLPNPWTGRTTGTAKPINDFDDSEYPSSNLDYETGSTAQGQIKVPNIDGTERIVNMSELQGDGPCRTALNVCCISCCPCFYGDPCTPEKKQSYLNFVKSLTFIFSAVQFIMLIVELIYGGFASFESNPSLGPGAQTLVDLGAKYGPLIRYDYQLWRLVTAIFLHAGIFHLIFNLWFQIRIGMYLERKWGIIPFLLLYFITGIGGNLMSCLLSPNDVGVGASTALLGILGCSLSEILITWRTSDPTARKTSLYSVAFSIIIIMILSIWSKYIDFGGHLGGLLVGALLGGAYFSKEHHNDNVTKYGSLAFGVLTLLYFILGFVIFYTAIDVNGS